MIPALVLTAGLGTRLQPLSFVRAKGALPIGDEPLARRILRWLATAGIRDAVLNLHHLPHTLTRAIGDGSDIGGGASIMGTLSGGGTQRVSIGERALLGANSGIGISIGDDSVVEAGLYVTAGTKVAVLGVEGEPDRVVKAVELSGQPNLLFRRNSLDGRVEVLSRSGEGVVLNTALHA